MGTSTMKDHIDPLSLYAFYIYTITQNQKIWIEECGQIFEMPLSSNRDSLLFSCFFFLVLFKKLPELHEAFHVFHDATTLSLLEIKKETHQV